MTQLYKRGTKGEMRTIIIESYNDRYEVHHGVLGGKMQTAITYPEPRNVGKSNETSIAEQALKESQSLIDRKIKSGYSLDKDNLSEIKIPMKVKIYQDNKSKIRSSALQSPKLNGVNGEFRLENGVLTLLSRGGEVYPELKHLTKDVITWMTMAGQTSINVELYKHGWQLQHITAAVKKFKPDTHKFPTSQIEAHIFELPNGPKIYSERAGIMYMTPLDDRSKLKVVPVTPAGSEESIELYHKSCIDNGYEGTIIRNSDAEYIYNTRSSDVFKYKKALDAEYKIVGMKLDKNSHPVFICEISDNGPQFKIKPKGTTSERVQIVVDFEEKYLGQWYTIEYECLSNDNIPLKPIGIALRNCDKQGNPTI